MKAPILMTLLRRHIRLRCRSSCERRRAAARRDQGPAALGDKGGQPRRHDGGATRFRDTLAPRGAVCWRSTDREQSSAIDDLAHRLRQFHRSVRRRHFGNFVQISCLIVDAASVLFQTGTSVFPTSRLLFQAGPRRTRWSSPARPRRWSQDKSLRCDASGKLRPLHVASQLQSCRHRPFRFTALSREQSGQPTPLPIAAGRSSKSPSISASPDAVRVLRARRKGALGEDDE